ncbi:MAG TPA: succinyl-diaminopimelate desuccinylase [Acidimicrobiia bacterium]|nr:succinyl-diaminopimelate desuccinylase [Acidimicrobiia bacterium]
MTVDTDLLALTEELCAIPSVSGDEGALADDVEQRVRGAAPAVLVDRIGANVVARTDLHRERRIVLGGHLDTVPPNGNAQPRRDGDVVHGLGTADMKGGLAVLLALARDLAQRAPRSDVTLVFYEGEEIADVHNGLRRLFAERPELVAGDLAILLEPTGGWVEAGCQGTIHMRATFHGVRAHSARPWMGTNAIHRAAPLLERCAAFTPARVDVDGLEYREALQVVRVEGGVANNVVPDRCDVVVNRRYAPARPLDAAIEELRVLCGDADEIEVLNASAAAPPNLTHPLIAELLGVYNLPVRPKLGWTDVARFAAHGIPACNLGPGDPTLAHTADERVDRADLEGCYRVLRSFCGFDRDG